MVCMSVSVSLNREPGKNGWTNEDAILVVDSGEPIVERIIHVGATWQILLKYLCAAVMWAVATVTIKNLFIFVMLSFL